MKRRLAQFLKVSVLLFVSVFSLISCTEDEESFEENLMYGKWMNVTLFEVYNADGTGKTWDTADDVKEDEAQSFTWTLDVNTLSQIHILEVGGKVPKTYTVVELTESTLAYEDDFGTVHSFVKVKD